MVKRHTTVPLILESKRIFRDSSDSVERENGNFFVLNYRTKVSGI